MRTEYMMRLIKGVREMQKEKDTIPTEYLEEGGCSCTWLDALLLCDVVEEDVPEADKVIAELRERVGSLEGMLEQILEYGNPNPALIEQLLKRGESDMEYRILNEGEIIQDGDEVDACRDGWRDDAKWQPAPKHMIGRKAVSPLYPAHSKYRRAINKHRKGE